MATKTTKFNNIQKHMIETEGFEMAKVTMYKQDWRTGGASSEIETYEGLVEITDCGIIWMIRPEASMRSNYKKQILTVSQRTISVERIAF